MKVSVQVEIVVPGYHRWAQASENLMHLRYRHAHDFKVTVQSNVTHNDREIEFYELRFVLERYFKDHYPHTDYGYEFGEESCETIAAKVMDHFPEFVRVSVFEDNGMGAIISKER